MHFCIFDIEYVPTGTLLLTHKKEIEKGKKGEKWEWKRRKGKKQDNRLE